MGKLPQFLLLIVGALTLAGCGPSDAFVGRWTYDPAQSDVATPDLVLSRLADGRIHSEGGGTADYDFRIDGGDSRTANGRIVSWRTEGPNGWTMTKSRDGKVAETTRVSLSVDEATLTTAAVGLLPDGSDFHRTTTWRRTAGGPGLPGRWRSIKVDTGATWDGYQISRRGDGVMVWDIPTDHQTITGRFDGTDLAIVGPGVPAGTTMAVRRVSPHELAVTMKAGGVVSEYGSVALSDDGDRMTEHSWAPGQEDRASKAVYVRTR